MGKTGYSNIKSYDIYLDDKLIASTAKLFYNANDLAPNTSYSFKVRSKDINNNQSEDSNIISFKTLNKLKIFDIKKYGAIGNGKFLNTKRIQAAINACTPDGKVVIPDGVFLSGALFLKSNTVLEINGTLMGSDNIEEYPLTSRRFKYYPVANYMGLINAYTEDYGSITNVKICGTGTVSGGILPNASSNYTTLGQKQARAKGDNARADLITIKGVDSLYIGGIKITNPCSHTIFISFSKNITVEGIDVRTFPIANGDGIDLATSDNIKLFNSFFDTGDDCINFNAGFGAEGINEGISLTNARIFNCTANHGHAGIAFGSHTGATIKNVLVEDCIFEGTERGIRFKTARQNGGGADNIILRDIRMKNIKREAITIDSSYSSSAKTPAPTPAQFKNITIKNIICEGSNEYGIFIKGLNDMYHSNIILENVTLKNTKGALIQFLKDSKFINVKLPEMKMDKWSINDTENLIFKDCEPQPVIEKKQ